MSTQTGGFPTGEMRASDADRDLAIAELSEHFQTGRLTQEEFDDRSARALQARTGQELSGLFADLPDADGPRGGTWPEPSWTGPSWPAPARPDKSASCRRPGALVILGVVAAVAIASLIGHVGIGHGGFGWLIPLFIVVLAARRIARRR
jgi:Domain of unknown function (DUF1707)